MVSWKMEDKRVRRVYQGRKSGCVFCTYISGVYMSRLQLYIIKKFPRPYVCYLMDDNYSYKPCGYNPLAYLHRFILRKTVKRLAVNYEKEFEEKRQSNPIRMIYTGNLLIGRANSLVEISKALARINKDAEKVVFDIFSPTVLNDKTMSYLYSNGCHFIGINAYNRTK